MRTSFTQHAASGRPGAGRAVCGRGRRLALRWLLALAMSLVGLITTCAPVLAAGPSAEHFGGTELEDRFGQSVSGEVIGAPGDGEGVGAAWDGREELQGAGEAGKAEFGYSVAESADGETLLVGGPGDDEGVGAVWAFTRSSGQWLQHGEKLIPESGDGFGGSVAVSGDGGTALVSGRESTWVLTRTGEEWTRQARLPAAGEVALSADGQTALVGSRVFTLSGEQWTQQADLTAEGHEPFARSVALSADGDTALIGGTEVAWVFTRSDGQWSFQSRLSWEPGGYLFGSSVALSAGGETALIGSPGCACGPEAQGTGGALAFGRFGSTWLPESKNLAEDTGEFTESSLVESEFGESVWLSGEGSTAVVGAPQYGGPGYPIGAVFRISGFLTPPKPPTALTKPATSVTASSATLNGTVYPNHIQVTECRFEYGPTPSYGSSAPCVQEPSDRANSVSVSATVEGLREDTPYHFRLVAANAVGARYGDDATFTTQAAVTSPPEYGRCMKVKAGTGSYANSGCTTAGGKATYEWFPGAERTGLTMQTKGHADIQLQSIGGIRVTCTAQTGTGEFTSRKSVGEVVLTLTGCERLGAKCTSAGAAEGEIVTAPLEGVLGIVAQGATSAKDKIGLDLFPAGRLGPMMEFACGSAQVSVGGSVLVPIATGKMGSSATLSYVQEEGRQKLEGFVGAAKDVLGLSFDERPAEACGLTLKTTEKYEQALEVNAAA